jgi:hypothetical protein
MSESSCPFLWWTAMNQAYAIGKGVVRAMVNMDHQNM